MAVNGTTSTANLPYSSNGIKKYEIGSFPTFKKGDIVGFRYMNEMQATSVDSWNSTIPSQSKNPRYRNISSAIVPIVLDDTNGDGDIFINMGNFNSTYLRMLYLTNDITPTNLNNVINNNGNLSAYIIAFNGQSSITSDVITLNMSNYGTDWELYKM